ncbi:MAG: hypothetical protein NT069_15130 [Planctomycetota bacterium]|nr:hypothetical protein [Planctomycetota bacterium]
MVGGTDRTVLASRFLACLLAICCCLSSAASQEPPAIENTPAADESSTSAGETAPKPNPLSPKQRSQIVSAGVVLLSVVIVLGIALLAVVLLIGARARRLIRTPLPDCQPRDEYWFLRKKAESTPRDPLLPPDSASSTPPSGESA